MSVTLPSPFAPAYADDGADAALCARACRGDASALTALVERHQRWIYNVALRLVLSPLDAEDLSQEALVRIITRLSQFEGRSAFRTWMYRIVVNCFLDGKRRKMEQAITTFTAYGEELDGMPSSLLEQPAEGDPERALLVEEVKVGCMLGMLLCLDREQRVVYVLGAIFDAPSQVAAEILEITPSAFRKRLERARRDLSNFMHAKCGLINTNNPCRCTRKTRAFIQEGWVDPERFKFVSEHVARLKRDAPARSKALCDLVEDRYAELYRGHPVLEGPDLAARLDQLLRDPSLRATFGLDGLESL